MSETLFELEGPLGTAQLIQGPDNIWRLYYESFEAKPTLVASYYNEADMKRDAESDAKTYVGLDGTNLERLKEQDGPHGC